jgi:hypothetical protein
MRPLRQTARLRQSFDICRFPPGHGRKLWKNTTMVPAFPRRRAEKITSQISGPIQASRHRRSINPGLIAETLLTRKYDARPATS